MNQGSPLWHVNNSFSREDKVAELAAYERMTRCLNGEAVDRPPNFDIFMTFAVRRTGKTQRAYYLDHRVLVEANMLMLEQFGSDIAQAISDPFSECYAPLYGYRRAAVFQRWRLRDSHAHARRQCACAKQGAGQPLQWKSNE